MDLPAPAPSAPAAVAARPPLCGPTGNHRPVSPWCVPSRPAVASFAATAAAAAATAAASTGAAAALAARHRGAGRAWPRSRRRAIAGSACTTTPPNPTVGEVPCGHLADTSQYEPNADAVTRELIFGPYAAWFQEHFVNTFALREVELLPHLAVRRGQTEATQSAELRTSLFESCTADSIVDRLRVTIVSNGTQLEALNVVVYPSHRLGPLPILGADLLSFNDNKRLLYGLDWSPMAPDKAYAEEYIAPHLATVRGGLHSWLATSPSNKIYGEAPEFFSPYMFFSRPENPDLLRYGAALWEVFVEYCMRYSDMLLHASALGDADPVVASQAKERHAAYERWHAARDPALLVFRRLFGAEWTEEYVGSVLFPGSAVGNPGDPRLTPLELHRVGVFQSEASPFPRLPADNGFCGSG